MDLLPESVLWRVLDYLREKFARDNVSLVCRRWYEIDRVQRVELKIGCRLNPPDVALSILCARFTNLSSVDISYAGWISSHGKQLDDSGLLLLATNCSQLSDLSLSFCSFVTDVGLSNLTVSEKLRALRLDFTPGVTGRGLLSFVIGCKSLTLLHIHRLLHLRSAEWLEFLGRRGGMQSLAIRNCRGIREIDLIRLGCNGWRSLQELYFEADMTHRRTTDLFAGSQGYWIPMHATISSLGVDEPLYCASLRILSLTNFMSLPESGLTWITSQCRCLRDLYLDTCVGMRDEDMLKLVQNCTQLRSMFLKIPYYIFSIHLPPMLTDKSFEAIASNCTNLESFSVSFVGGDYKSFITEEGLISIIRGCSRLKSLSVTDVYPFTDKCLAAVHYAKSLEVLQLTLCKKVSDAGIKDLLSSTLKELRISRCHQLTDAGFFDSVGTRKLRYLGVDSCSNISGPGVSNVAYFVNYVQV